MVVEGPGEVLYDRRSEREVLSRLLGAVRGGQSRVLVITGEPGVGKTALLESAIGTPSEFRVLRLPVSRQPLACVVDDAQWLDGASAQALAFVARRLFAESVALLFLTREPSEELKGLPALVLDGLRNGDAQHRSRGLRPTGPRTRRSPHNCSSARAPPTTTYARHSANSE